MSLDVVLCFIFSVDIDFTLSHCKYVTEAFVQP